MITGHEILRGNRGLVAAAVAATLLVGCATAPTRPPGADQARAELIRLQADPSLAPLAPAAIADAVIAVQAAEQPQTDEGLGAYRVYIADRKIDIARAQAQTQLYENQRMALEAQRQNARLDARTREVDAARGQVLLANADADAANANAAVLAAQAAELQRQINVLDARVTERGLVLTLGDVLFETNRAELRAGTNGHLDKLVDFLTQYADRTVLIEGYTDSTGSVAYNQDLSLRRAAVVRDYLQAHGINGARLTASGHGDSDPVASNDSSTGRQQNRRVEVIVSNPAIASR
jgi:outer membrane protein OmpA-like peptidoglycan-associated protein